MTTKKQTIEKVNESPKEVTLNSPAPAMSPAPMTMAAAPMAAPSTDATEDQLPAQNNFEFVRALDAKGESILINKSDLVSVLEGLIIKLQTISYQHIYVSAKGWYRIFKLNGSFSLLISHTTQYNAFLGASHIYSIIANYYGGTIQNLSELGEKVGIDGYRVVKKDSEYFIDARYEGGGGNHEFFSLSGIACTGQIDIANGLLVTDPGGTEIIKTIFWNHAE